MSTANTSATQPLSVFETKLQGISNRFRAKTADDRKLGAIPWDKIIEILGPFLTQLMANCNKQSPPAQVVQALRNPTLRDRAVLRLAIRRELDSEPESRSRRAVRGRVSDLMDACMEEARESDEETVRQFVNETASWD